MIRLPTVLSSETRSWSTDHHQGMFSRCVLNNSCINRVEINRDVQHMKSTASFSIRACLPSTQSPQTCPSLPRTPSLYLPCTLHLSHAPTPYPHGFTFYPTTPMHSLQRSHAPYPLFPCTQLSHHSHVLTLPHHSHPLFLQHSHVLTVPHLSCTPPHLEHDSGACPNLRALGTSGRHNARSACRNDPSPMASKFFYVTPDDPE